MDDIICITVSTNYSDILDIILPINYKFFKKWYIITDKNDTETINIINKYNYNNIEILYFNFSDNNYKFNKGGAIKYTQLLVEETYPNSVILLLDSDICLPSNCLELLQNINIKNDTLYGVEARLDYYTLEDYLYNIKHTKYVGGNDFYGFFQLFKSNLKYLYKDSFNAGVCDHEFKLLFKNKETISGLSVKHLGRPNINWDGRNKNRDRIV